MELETVSMIKSCIVSRKGGVPFVELSDEYQELVGESIPFEKLGFQSLGSFISSVPEVKAFRNEDGVMMLTLQDEKVAHISALVNRQKAPPTKWKRKDLFKTSVQNKRRDGHRKRQKVQQQYTKDCVGKENSFSRQNMPEKNKITSTHSSNRASHVRNERRALLPNMMEYIPAGKVHHSDHNRFCNKKPDDECSGYYSEPLPSYSRDKYCSRQAIMVGDILTVTVKNTNFASDEYSDSVNLVDENNSFHDDDIVKDKAADVLDLPDKDDVQSYVEPTLFHHQMIGDDFFLHLAEKSLGAYPDRRCNLMYSSGLCISGQRIRECWHRILDSPVSGNRMILLLGAVDILEGMDLADLMSSMLNLLDTLLSQVRYVIVLTIPPLVNVCHIQQKWRNLLSFNKWLKQLDIGGKCHVLDIWPLFKGRRVEMYDYFEHFPRKLVGTYASMVLWNSLGRKHVVEFLRGELFLQL